MDRSLDASAPLAADLPDARRSEPQAPGNPAPVSAPPPPAADAAARHGPWLDLPLPDKLVAEATLGEADSRRLRAVLRGLLEALELDHPSCLKQLDALLRDIPPPLGPPAEIDTAGLQLTSFQAKDYDRYFRVNRLSSDTPAIAMVRSLVQTARAVTHLFERSHHLAPLQVRRQIDGFVCHTHLLARTFGLEPLA